MNISNYIELGILLLTIIGGIITKVRAKKAVDDLDGFSGIKKKSQHKGNVTLSVGDKK